MFREISTCSGTPQIVTTFEDFVLGPKLLLAAPDILTASMPKVTLLLGMQ